MNSWSSPLRGSVKTATRVAMPLCTRSAASSAPAPPEPSDTTMMSAGATGSLTTSAHPRLRTGSRTEGTPTMVAAANATTTRIGAHLGHRELILWFPLFIAGLAFEHIYAASAVPCEYDPYFYDPPSGNPE